MKYDYTDVKTVRFDRVTKRVEIVSGDGVVMLDGVERVMLKSVPFFDQDGVAHLNRGRASVSSDGKEVVAGD